LNARGSSGNPAFLFGMMCRDAILLSQDHINQLAEGICLYKVQTFFELSAQAPTETVLLLLPFIPTRGSDPPQPTAGPYALPKCRTYVCSATTKPVLLVALATRIPTR
jgi:hypothetical protein